MLWQTFLKVKEKCAKILNYGVFCDSITWNMYIFHYTLEEEMSRVEFLKKFVAFNKRHKVPLPLIKAQLYVILVVCFIHYAIVKGINAIKYAICYPFIKIRDYCRHNIRSIFQIECLMATIGICLLLIGHNGSIDMEQVQTGALAGETYVGGDVVVNADDEKEETSFYEVTTGNISNTDGESDDESGNDTEMSVQSEFPYKIMVNRLANCITIYTLDENNQYTVPYKAMICSAGGSETPAGKFNISSKYDFKTLFYKSYGQYCSRIYGSILFHSSGNNSLNKDDLNAEDFNNLGQGVSHGCIRLTVADAKWIYDNCPSGTEVVIYDSDYPGPLGKPECIKVPEGTRWDPTDPDENNPWNDKMPWIEGAEDKLVYEDDVIDYCEGVRAYDTCGNDITDKLVVEGNVNLDIPGEYLITYSVTDLLGRTAECQVIYTVR